MQGLSVWSLHNETHHSPGPIELNLLDVVIVGVTPVHGTGAVVQSQTIRPQHVGGDENATVGPIHPGFLYPPDAVIDLVLLPVRPVHPAIVHTHTHTITAQWIWWNKALLTFGASCTSLPQIRPNADHIAHLIQGTLFQLSPHSSLALTHWCWMVALHAPFISFLLLWFLINQHTLDGTFLRASLEMMYSVSQFETGSLLCTHGKVTETVLPSEYYRDRYNTTGTSKYYWITVFFRKLISWQEYSHWNWNKLISRVPMCKNQIIKAPRHLKESAS